MLWSHLDGLSCLHGDLVISGIPVGQAQVIVLDVNVQVGQNQLYTAQYSTAQHSTAQGNQDWVMNRRSNLHSCPGSCDVKPKPTAIHNQ